MRSITRVKIAYLAYSGSHGMSSYLSNIIFELMQLCNDQEIKQIQNNIEKIYMDRSWFKYKFSGACHMPRNKEEYLAIRDLVEKYCHNNDCTIEEYDLIYGII